MKYSFRLPCSIYLGKNGGLHKSFVNVFRLDCEFVTIFEFYIAFVYGFNSLFDSRSICGDFSNFRAIFQCILDHSIIKLASCFEWLSLLYLLAERDCVVHWPDVYKIGFLEIF